MPFSAECLPSLPKVSDWTIVSELHYSRTSLRPKINSHHEPLPSAFASRHSPNAWSSSANQAHCFCRCSILGKVQIFCFSAGGFAYSFFKKCSNDTPFLLSVTPMQTTAKPSLVPRGSPSPAGLPHPCLHSSTSYNVFALSKIHWTKKYMELYKNVWVDLKTMLSK